MNVKTYANSCRRLSAFVSNRKRETKWTQRNKILPTFCARKFSPTPSAKAKKSSSVRKQRRKQRSPPRRRKRKKSGTNGASRSEETKTELQPPLLLVCRVLRGK